MLQEKPRQLNPKNSSHNLNFKSTLALCGQGAFCILEKIGRIDILAEKLDWRKAAPTRSD
jgi:hypothetical protein